MMLFHMLDGSHSIWFTCTNSVDIILTSIRVSVLKYMYDHASRKLTYVTAHSWVWFCLTIAQCTVLRPTPSSSPWWLHRFWSWETAEGRIWFRALMHTVRPGALTIHATIRFRIRSSHLRLPDIQTLCVKIFPKTFLYSEKISSCMSWIDGVRMQPRWWLCGLWQLAQRFGLRAPAMDNWRCCWFNFRTSM